MSKAPKVTKTGRKILDLLAVRGETDSIMVAVGINNPTIATGKSLRRLVADGLVVERIEAGNFRFYSLPSTEGR